MRLWVMEATDQNLIGRLAQHGDPEAFSTLLGRYADMVYSTSLRILRDPALAADVTQETFFQLLKSAGRVTGSASGWLHQVATRRAVDVVRQNVSRRKREHGYAQEQSEGGEGTWLEVAPLVDAALEELPEEHREMLIQHFLQRKSMGQIAAARGISQPTVSRRVAEGLEWVRESLRGKGIAIGVVPLQTLMLYTAEAAPESVLRALGKVALAQAAGAPAALTGGSLLGGAGAVGFTAAAAVVAVAFNIMLPEPQWSPTTPIPKAVRTQAASTNSERVAVVSRAPVAAAVTAVAPPAEVGERPAVKVQPARTYAIARPVLRVPGTNGPPSVTNAPAARGPSVWMAGPGVNQVPGSALDRPYGWQAPIPPQYLNSSQVRAVAVGSGIGAGVSSFQLDRLRTNRFRAQGGQRSYPSSSYQSNARLGPSGNRLFAPAVPARKAPAAPKAGGNRTGR